MAKELERLEEDKRRTRNPLAREMEDMRTRVHDLEGSLQRLGETVASSQKSMEDMMRKILEGQQQPRFVPTTEATKLVQADSVLPTLNPGTPSDIAGLVIRSVDGSVGEDVVADIVSNKEGVESGVLPDISGAHEQEVQEVGGDGSNSGTAEVDDMHALVDQAAVQRRTEVTQGTEEPSAEHLVSVNRYFQLQGRARVEADASISLFLEVECEILGVKECLYGILVSP